MVQLFHTVSTCIWTSSELNLFLWKAYQECRGIDMKSVCIYYVPLESNHWSISWYEASQNGRGCYCQQDLSSMSCLSVLPYHLLLEKFNGALWIAPVQRDRPPVVIMQKDHFSSGSNYIDSLFPQGQTKFRILYFERYTYIGDSWTKITMQKKKKKDLVLSFKPFASRVIFDFFFALLCTC